MQLNWLCIIPKSKRSLVLFPVRAFAWVVTQWGSPERQPHIDVALSLSPSRPLCLEINRIFKMNLKNVITILKRRRFETMYGLLGFFILPTPGGCNRQTLRHIQKLHHMILELHFFTESLNNCGLYSVQQSSVGEPSDATEL